VVGGGHRRRRSALAWIITIACVVSLVLAGTLWLAVHRSNIVISGTPRAGEPVGTSDEDQIRGVLQAISDAYNRKDVSSAEGNLCPQVRGQWNPQLESVWMKYRLRHGAEEFTIESIDVSGAAAHITGTQRYANDVKPHDFMAEMGRGAYGWKMCSST
jgi:hypothetical protein